MNSLLLRGLGILLLLPNLSLAQEAVVTLRSTVTGNQEQPKVMYIVPWQPSLASEFEYLLGSGLAQDLFTEIDRDEFVRELSYRKMITRPSMGDRMSTLSVFNARRDEASKEGAVAK
jgi:hypothetical protein